MTVPDDDLKHTLRWKPADFRRVEEAAKMLGDSIHAEVSVPDFMRGAVMRRADEILGTPSPVAA